MKKIITFSLLIFSITSFISSCSKKKDALNFLAGTWTYQTVKDVNSGLTDSASHYGYQTLYFDACANYNTHCNGTITVSNSVSYFAYDLNSAGTVANVYNSDGTTSAYSITKLDAHNFVYNTPVTNGHILEFTLTK